MIRWQRRTAGRKCAFTAGPDRGVPGLPKGARGLRTKHGTAGRVLDRLPGRPRSACRSAHASIVAAAFARHGYELVAPNGMSGANGACAVQYHRVIQCICGERCPDSLPVTMRGRHVPNPGHPRLTCLAPRPISRPGCRRVGCIQRRLQDLLMPRRIGYER